MKGSVVELMVKECCQVKLITPDTITSLVLFLFHETLPYICVCRRYSSECTAPSGSRSNDLTRLSFTRPYVFVAADRQHVVCPIHGSRPECVQHVVR